MNIFKFRQLFERILSNLAQKKKKNFFKQRVGKKQDLHIKLLAPELNIFAGLYYGEIKKKKKSHWVIELLIELTV